MTKNYDPDHGLADCEPTIFTCTYHGIDYSAEGIGSYPDEWPDDGSPEPDAFNSAWEQIAAALPPGEPGDVVNLTQDDLFHAGSLRWERMAGDGYWSYSPDARRCSNAEIAAEVDRHDSALRIARDKRYHAMRSALTSPKPDGEC